MVQHHQVHPPLVQARGQVGEVTHRTGQARQAGHHDLVAGAQLLVETVPLGPASEFGIWLVDAGLVERTSTQRGLPIALTLTPAGLVRLAQASPTSHELNEEIMCYLEPELGVTVAGALRLLLSDMSGPGR